MAERFKPTNTVIIKCVQDKMQKNFSAEKKQPFSEHYIMRTMYPVGRHTKSRYDQYCKKNGMSKPTMSKQVL